MVHKRIVPHALHQQRHEKHVQNAALPASNHVGEGHRSDRSAGLSYTMRPFNGPAVATANKYRKEKAETPLRELKVASELAWLSTDTCDSFRAHADLTRANAGGDQCRRRINVDGDANGTSHMSFEVRGTGGNMCEGGQEAVPLLASMHHRCQKLCECFYIQGF